MGDKAGGGAGRARRNAALSQGLGRPSGARRSSQQRSADTRRARGGVGSRSGELAIRRDMESGALSQRLGTSLLARNRMARSLEGRGESNSRARRFINDDPPATIRTAGTTFRFTTSRGSSGGGRQFSYRSDGGSSFSVITTGRPGDSNAVVRIGT